MGNNNGTDIFGFDDKLERGMTEGWWRIGNGRNSQRYQQMFFGSMKKETGIGDGDIKDGEYPLGGRVIFVGWKGGEKGGR